EEPAVVGVDVGGGRVRGEKPPLAGLGGVQAGPVPFPPAAAPPRRAPRAGGGGRRAGSPRGTDPRYRPGTRGRPAPTGYVSAPFRSWPCYRSSRRGARRSRVRRRAVVQGGGRHAVLWVAGPRGGARGGRTPPGRGSPGGRRRAGAGGARRDGAP